MRVSQTCLVLKLKVFSASLVLLFPRRTPATSSPSFLRTRAMVLHRCRRIGHPLCHFVINNAPLPILIIHDKLSIAQRCPSSFLIFTLIAIAEVGDALLRPSEFLLLRVVVVVRDGYAFGCKVAIYRQ